MRYADSDDKWNHARKLFEEAVDHCEDAHREAHRAMRFYHNSLGEGQWDSDDLEYLRSNGRPAYTFNIIKPKVDTFHGMYADSQRLPNVVASQGQDELLADAIQHVIDEILEDAKYERLAGRQLKTGTIAGECALQIEVAESSLGDDWIKVNLYRILPYELHWDIASIEPDRSDARYVFHDRWYSKEEWASEYPEHADMWEIMARSDERHYSDPGDSWEEGENGSYADVFAQDDYQSEDRYFKYYYDRTRNKARVIRYEYKTFATKYYLTDTRTMQRVEVGDEEYERGKMAQEIGMPIVASESEEEVIHVCEFSGKSLLREYEEPGPFEGFSVVDYCYDIDEETGTAYGLVRNLFDPQMELNKGKSLETEIIAQGVKGGVIAEKDQIDDEDQFNQQRRTPGGVAYVKKNALVEGRIQDSPPTPPNPAVMARIESAMQLLDEVSTIPSNTNLPPAAHAQAGVTVAIRYHKSRQAVSDPFANFEDCQKLLFRKIAQAVVGSMPDEQIQEMLGTDSKYVIQNGVIIKMVEQVAMNPQTGQSEPQLVPGEQAEMRNIRNMRWKLDMEYTTENSTLRLLQFDVLLQLLMAGQPVDPEVLFEYAINSKAAQEKLIKFAEQAQKAQAEGAQAQQQALEAQNQQYMQIEGAKIQETQRSNMADEALKLSDQEIRERLEMMDLYIQADQAEQDRLFEAAKAAVEQETRQKEAMSNAQASVG